ncbi:uncharacterized protein LOC124457267 [Xenia sp. Carnegie-2017]|uniref:uncharacterized protein LOC124457267 n=1 Tax=Xenia sp. Carnegie-2017 TaxID=2897299 RepID=UPI001F03E8C0|nr:uncharacterized protein LOC124457267 [Xenia sp. Carnegie-2017]
MQSREKINNSYLQEILTDVVEKKLVDLFIQNWDTHYKTSHGEWENTNVSGMKLFNIEKTKMKPKPHDKHIMSKFQDGDTSKWDCTTLFAAILFSNSSFKDLAFSFTEINKIKCQRNTFNSFQKLPCKPNHNVVKRTELLNQITADLNNLRSTNNNELTYYYISGNPGSGKSELARQICEEMYNSFDWENKTTFVMTLEGKDIDSLLKTYAELCQRLSNDKTVIENNLKEARTHVDSLAQRLLFHQELCSDSLIEQHSQQENHDTPISINT